MNDGRTVLWIFLSLAAVLGVYLGVCRMILTVLIVPERKPHERSPADLGIPRARELWFRSRADGVLLRGWLVPGGRDAAVILVHGLHSHAWDGGAPDLVRAYAKAGFDVLLFDLRAHGASGGDHAGLGLLERGDLRAAVDVLLEEGVAPGRIGVHGTSYGAAVALLATPEIEAIGAVIADSSFSSVRAAVGAELARRTGLPSGAALILLPGLRLLASGIYGLRVEDAAPEAAIARIAPRPVLLVHGAEDTAIRHDHAGRLDAAGPSAALWTLPGAEHTQGIRLVPDCETPAPSRGAYLRRSVGFFRRHLAPGQAGRAEGRARIDAGSGRMGG